MLSNHGDIVLASFRIFSGILFTLLVLSGCSMEQKLVHTEPYYTKLSMYDRTVFVYETDALFRVASTKPKPSFKRRLDDAVIYAKANPDLKVLVQSFGGVESHSDQSLEDNDFRAEAVASYFWQQGIQSDRIGYQGFAAGRALVSTDNTPAGSSENRRIEISFVPNLVRG